MRCAASRLAWAAGHPHRAASARLGELECPRKEDESCGAVKQGCQQAPPVTQCASVCMTSPPTWLSVCTASVSRCCSLAGVRQSSLVGASRWCACVTHTRWPHQNRDGPLRRSPRFTMQSRLLSPHSIIPRPHRAATVTVQATRCV